MKKKRAVYFGLVGFIAAAAVLFVEIWAINWRFLVDVIFGADHSFMQKIAVLGTTGESFKSSFPLLAQIAMLALAILAGIYISLFLYYLLNHYRMNKAAGLGVAGSLLGSLGIGCGACGSIVLSSLLGAGTSASILSVLPLDGLEFSFAGIAILAVAIFVLARELHNGLACRRN